MFGRTSGTGCDFAGHGSGGSFTHQCRQEALLPLPAQSMVGGMWMRGGGLWGGFQAGLPIGGQLRVALQQMDRCLDGEVVRETLETAAKLLHPYVNMLENEFGPVKVDGKQLLMPGPVRAFGLLHQESPSLFE